MLNVVCNPLANISGARHISIRSTFQDLNQHWQVDLKKVLANILIRFFRRITVFCVICFGNCFVSFRCFRVKEEASSRGMCSVVP